jgi:anion-transporting  ArsA/GET3 family ATPase
MFDKRLLFVSGKGGVGRTTVAAVLGLVAAERGLRTIVAGVGGRDELPALFAPTATGGAAPGRAAPGSAARGRAAPGSAARVRAAPGRAAAKPDAEQKLVPGLFSIAIDPERAMEEYLRDQLPVAALADLLTSSRTFGYLAAATPGLRELLTVGKVWELAQPERRTAGGEPYDLVIVDGPATGYVASLLASPGTFTRVARRGPISRHAATIHDTLVDPGRTGVIGVSRPEEAAVSEVLATRARLDEELGIELGAVIVNAVRRQRFATRDRGRLRAAVAEQAPGTSAAGAMPAGTVSAGAVSAGAMSAGAMSAGARRAVALALAEDERIREERRQLGRLAVAVARDPVELPFVGSRELGRESLVELARVLEESG